VGRRVADVAFAIYGSDRYLEANPSQDMKDHVWLAGDETLANAPVAGWMNEHVPEDKIAFRADSFLALGHAAEAGLGLSALPCCLADAMPSLRRFKGPIKELGTGLWLLSHRDLSDAARVRAFMDHVFDGLSADRDRLEGRSRT
jgi:DNA-binding transcriptional LysR family regulator